METYKLLPFSESESPIVGASLSLKGSSLTLAWTVSGDISKINFNPSSNNIRELWKHTCFELFLKDSSGQYFEWNISPTKQHYCFQFESYRKEVKAPSPELQNLLQSIAVKKTADLFTIEAKITLPEKIKEPSISITSVLEHSNGSLSYWAIKHTNQKPDFHSPDTFIGISTQ